MSKKTLSIKEVEKIFENKYADKVIDVKDVDGNEFSVALKDIHRNSVMTDMVNEAKDLAIKYIEEEVESNESEDILIQNILIILFDALFIKYFTDVEGYDKIENAGDQIAYYKSCTDYLVDIGVFKQIVDNYDDVDIVNAANMFFEMMDKEFEAYTEIVKNALENQVEEILEN